MSTNINNDQSPSRLAFGSCTSHHHKEQPFWNVIRSRNVSAFIWAGDAVYADDRVEWIRGKRKMVDATPDYLQYLYEKQRNVPGYRALIDRNLSIFGTLDDHDYGRNNGDRTFPWRRESGIEFIKFLGLSNDSAMARRAFEGKGVYGVQVYDFGQSDSKLRILTDTEAGLDPDVIPFDDYDRQNNPPIEDNNKNRLVAIFVLDIRSNRTPWPKTIRERFSQNAQGDFLGEEQFEWFETAIGRSRAAVNIVVTGLQVHAERFYDGSVVENWNGFPGSQHRLYQALLQPNVQSPILMTGDVHHAQLLRKDCRHPIKNSVRPLYEITTSGMTHAWGATQSSTCARSNISPFCRAYYYNKLYGLSIHLAHWLSPWNELIIDETTNQLQYSLNLNIAELEFDWEEQQVLTRILGPNGEILLHQLWSFDQLYTVRDTLVKESDFVSIQRILREKTILDNDNNDDWICVHYRGIPQSTSFFLGILTSASLAAFLWMAPWLLALFLVKKIFLGRRRYLKKEKEE